MCVGRNTGAHTHLVCAPDTCANACTCTNTHDYTRLHTHTHECAHACAHIDVRSVLAGKPRARKQAGLNLLWNLEDLRVCEATQEQASLASRSKTQLPLAETTTSDTQGGLQSLLHELEWSERAVATQEPPGMQVCVHTRCAPVCLGLHEYVCCDVLVLTYVCMHTSCCTAAGICVYRHG